MFFRRLRASLDGASFPYLWVPEWHPGGHGLHLHFAVGRFVPRQRIEAAWGRGFVHIKLLGDLPVGSTSLTEARVAGGYLAKYVGKTFDHDHPAGLRRFDVAQGFAPRSVPVIGASRGEVLERASEQMGSDPSWVWLSDERDGWRGPPAVAASWG